MRYSYVEHAGPMPRIRRRSLYASGFLCLHKTVRIARRMNIHARRTPAMRRARWINARHTRGTRGAHAGHALCVRRLRSSAPLAHPQRAFNACAARPAFFWRVSIPSSLLLRPSWVSLSFGGSASSAGSTTPSL